MALGGFLLYVMVLKYIPPTDDELREVQFNWVNWRMDTFAPGIHDAERPKLFYYIEGEDGMAVILNLMTEEEEGSTLVGLVEKDDWASAMEDIEEGDEAEVALYALEGKQPYRTLTESREALENNPIRIILPAFFFLNGAVFLGLGIWTRSNWKRAARLPAP